MEKPHTMEKARAGWRSTGVLCLLVACSACSHRRSAIGRTDLTPHPIQGGLPRACADPTVCRQPRFRTNCQAARCKIWADCENFYCRDVACDLALSIAGAGVLANTSLDQDFRDWYQDDVKSPDSERFADAYKVFGEGYYFVPAFLGMAVVGSLADENSCGSEVGKFGSRVTRGYLVGGPPVLVMQCALGGSRPTEGEDMSRWKPLSDTKGVSGHAFMGAVPFITAAKMTDRPLLKASLYACSTLTAWSRIDHDRHYLSQVCLGWWMAYLASSAVDKTENDYEHLTLTPVTTPEMVGIGAVYER